MTPEKEVLKRLAEAWEKINVVDNNDYHIRMSGCSSDLGDFYIALMDATKLGNEIAND